MGRTAKLSMLACSMVLVVAGAVQALPILPSQTVVLVAPEIDPVGGVVVGGPLTLPFSTSTFSGTLTSTVIAGDTTNLLGGLTFVYELSNSQASADALHRLTINGFTGYATDGSYQAVVGAQAPTTVDRSVNGDVIGFGFIGAPLGFGDILPGESSAVLVVQTNAPAYQETFASVIDGTVTNVGTYSPVPEPVTMSLMVAGFGLLLVRRR